MFFTKNLLGTPQRVTNNDKRYEFTPIGAKPTRGSPEKLQGDLLHSLKGHTGSRRFNAQEVNNSIMDSSFDETTDNFNNTTIAGMPSLSLKPLETNMNQNSGRPLSFSNKFGQSGNNLVDNGMNSIKEQQYQLQRLQTENYNLKIEVATLNKFLKKTPQEQRELASENIDLKQRLLESVTQIKELQTNLKELELYSNKENISESGQQDQIDSIKLLFQQAAQEKDDRIRQLEQKLEELTDRDVEQVRIPDEILERLEYLQSENQQLRRTVDELNESLNDSSATKIQLNEAREEAQRLNVQIESLKKQAMHTEYERGSFEANVKTLQTELNNKETELNNLRDDLQSWKDKYSSINARFSGISSVNTISLSRADKELSDLKEIKDREIQRLKNIVHDLREDIKEKEAEESTLRSQLKLATSKASMDREADINQSRTNLLKSHEVEIKQLKEELAKYQDEAYQTNVDASRIFAIQQENQELYRELQTERKEFTAAQKENKDLINKLDYFEKEYATALAALESAESEIRSLKLRFDKQIAEAEEENQKLLNKVKIFSRKYDESALLELENVNRKRDEYEKRQLLQQVNDLNIQLANLQRDLELEKTNKGVPHANTSYLETEYQKISKEKNQLKLAKDENEIEIQEFTSKCNKLQAAIADKDALIETLEGYVRDLNRQLKLISLSGTKDDDLSRVKNDYEIKLRDLESDYQKLENDYRDQVAYYKNKINILMDEKYYTKPNDPERSLSPLIALLEQQLENSKNTNNTLSINLSDAVSKETALTTQLSDLQSKMNAVTEKNSSLQRDKSKLEDIISSLETDAKLMELERTKLESKTRSLASELSTSFKHCTKLANKLNDNDINAYRHSSMNEDEVVRAKRNNAYLRKQIDHLTHKLSTTKITPPSSPRYEFSDELKLLKHQLQYYKVVLHDMNLKSNDLSFMNDFMIKSVKNSNQLIKNDLVKLAHCGIYPDYTSMDLQRLKNGGKLSFRIVATFVLAMVKIKRRQEKADYRKTKLNELKNEIEKDKINLLVG